VVNYRLGVDVGTSFTAAAIWRQHENKTETVALGSRMLSVPSVLFVGADGSMLVGEVAERRALTDPDRVVREFKRRIGDTTPLFVGGQPYVAHDLAAMMVRWVIDQVAEREGGPADQIAITHPAGWGPFKKDLLAQALSALGLNDVTLLAEPAAAAVSYASQQRVEAGATIAVYDLGGGTFDAAVVRKTGADSFALLGSADGLQQLGGADFDEAVFSHVRDRLSVQPDMTPWDALDIEDPSVLSGLTRLRRECTEAKEALSSDTEVTIPVLLPGASTQIRLVRGEFEEMIRPALEETVGSLSRAIRSAGVSPDELDAVLLVGGSSRTPLVSQLVSAQLGCPVRADADPQATIALGAALSLAPQATPACTVPTITAAPAGDPDSESATSRLPQPSQLNSHAPDRPPMIPIPRKVVEDQQSPGADMSLRRRLVAGRVRNVVGTGVLSGVLLIALAVAAPGDLLSFTDAPGDTAPATVESPGGAVAAGEPGGHVEMGGAASPDLADSGKKATKVAQTASRPKTAASTASQPERVSSAPLVGQAPDPVSSNPPVPIGDGSPGAGTPGDAGSGDGGSGDAGSGDGGSGDAGSGDGGSGDAGSGDGGSGDGGSGDAGSGDGGSGDAGSGDAGSGDGTNTPSDPPPTQTTA
jgi:molecular chaperone DnaK